MLRRVANGNTTFFQIGQGRGFRIFAEAIVSGEQRLGFPGKLLKFLRSNSKAPLNPWLREIHDALVADLILAGTGRLLTNATLNVIIERTAKGGVSEEMTLGQFSGHGEGNDRINLSTLHSAKGREFALVIMFAMDNGRIPWRNVAATNPRVAPTLLCWVYPGQN